MCMILIQHFFTISSTMCNTLLNAFFRFVLKCLLKNVYSVTDVAHMMIICCLCRVTLNCCVVVRQYDDKEAPILLNTLEYVAMTISMRHVRRGAVEISLMSPKGTSCKLSTLRPKDR